MNTDPSRTLWARRGHMPFHEARILLLIACFMTVGPLAYASPPDPVWLAGIYDAGDLDDAVQLACSTDAGLPDGLSGVSSRSLPPAEGWRLERAPAPSLARPRSISTRAPPPPEQPCTASAWAPWLAEIALPDTASGR